MCNTQTYFRKDLMQSVFLPLFSKISELVQAQIRKVESMYNQAVKVSLIKFFTLIWKVLFLVGGLGSNEFLAKYLKSRIKLGIVVKQPSAGFVFRSSRTEF